MSEQLLREGFELLAETLQGGPERRLRSHGRFGPKLGGPQRLATLFPPAAVDEQTTAAFRERHEKGMRAEVFAAVSRVLERWADPTRPDINQSDFDDWFVALAHLQLLLRDRRGRQPGSPAAERLAERCQAVQDLMAESWLQPLIRAKLNAPDPAPDSR
jgi:hypothetical protein